MNPLRSFLGGAVARKSALDSRALLELISAGAASKAGANVNVTTALKVSAVLGCMRVLAEGFAQIPFRLMIERKSGKKEAATAHPLYDVIHRQPNAFQTSFEWRETSLYHAGLTKGAFGIPNRVRGQTVEILPVVPGNVTIRQDARFNTVYEVKDGQNGIVGTFPRSEILHLRGPSWNGFEAMSLVQLAADAVGLAIAIEDTQSRLHANGARPGGLLTYADALTPEQKTAIGAAWSTAFGGGNQFGTAVMDLGAKYEQLAMTGVDAQTLESRKHQVEEIARIFRVFPVLLGYSDKAATFASTEQFFIAHVVHSLGPWIERAEQAMDCSLLSKEERAAGYFTKFSVQGLMRGDAKSRAEFYKASLGTSSSPGWNTPNDIRRLEDQDPSDDEGANSLVTVNRLAGNSPPAPGEGKSTP